MDKGLVMLGKGSWAGYIKAAQLFELGHWYTGAGSNPREYQGLRRKSTNAEIARTAIVMPHHFPKFHGGVTINVVGSEIAGDELAWGEWSEACLTNGLQTRSVLMLLRIARTYVGNRNQIPGRFNPRNLEDSWRQLVTEAFPDSESCQDQGLNLGPQHLNQVLGWLNDSDLQDMFLALAPEDFDSIHVYARVEDITQAAQDLNATTNALGTQIADAHNSTQAVKPEDLLGTTYYQELEEVFTPFAVRYQGQIVVEYRHGTAPRKSDKTTMSLLDLFRMLVPLGLVTPDASDSEIHFAKQIALLSAARRGPFIDLFRSIMAHRTDHRVQSLLQLWAQLLPLVYEDVVRELPKLAEDCFDDLVASGGISSTGVGFTIPDERIRQVFRFPTSALQPIVLYGVRNRIQAGPSGAVAFHIPKHELANVVYAAYEGLVARKREFLAAGRLGSSSDIVRDSRIFLAAANTDLRFLRNLGKAPTGTPQHEWLALSSLDQRGD